MQNDFSIMTEQFRQQLINTINGAQLPPSVVYYVLTNVYQDTERYYRQYLQKAQQEAEKQEELQNQEVSNIVQMDEDN